MRLDHVTLGLASRMRRQRLEAEGTVQPANGASRTKTAPADLEGTGDAIMREQLEALGYL
jgi:hypothetical protein